MKIGVLTCGEVHNDHLEEHGDYHQMISVLFANRHEPLVFRSYMAIHGELPQSIDECDAYIISGSPKSVYESHDWIDKLEDFIRQLDSAKKKLIGICFGHQLIAQALGGKVEKSDKGWGVGLYENQIIEQSWMSQPSESITLLASHQDQVITPPQHAKTIGQSAFCPHYMLQIEQHILTVQGHPEFTKAYVKTLIESRSHILSPSEYQGGLDSLTLDESDTLFAHWMIDFIQNKR